MFSNKQAWTTTTTTTTTKWVAVEQALSAASNTSAHVYGDGNPLFFTTYNDKIPRASWQGVAYGQGKFVAIASQNTNPFYPRDAQTAISYDGINWESYTDIEQSYSWADIAYGRGIFVAVALDHVGVSSDGINWTYPYVFTQASHRIRYGGGRFIAWNSMATSTYVYVSSDGSSWTAVTIDSAAKTWRDIYYGNGMWMATGALGNEVFVSTDNGTTWTQLTTAPNLSASTITYIIDDSMWIIVGISPSTYNTEQYYSTDDGATWTQNPNGAASIADRLVNDGQNVLGFAANGIEISRDKGATWLGTEYFLLNGRGIAYGNGT